MHLAVRGRLTSQHEGDVSGAKDKRHAAPSKAALFSLPKNWAWAQVSDVAESRLGKMLDKAKNKGHLRPYLRNVNVRWFGFDLTDLLDMRFEDSELAEYALRRGDVLICEGGEPGRAAVWESDLTGIYFQKAIHRLRFSMQTRPQFFAIALKASALDGRLKPYFTGSGIKHLTGRSLSDYLFPCPPVPEQLRIVAKVDELMALCDRLEAAQKEREAARRTFALSALTNLQQPANGGGRELRRTRSVALGNLSAITGWPKSIDELRKAVRNLGIRGQLGTQVPLERADARLASKGGPAVFPVRDSWQWVHLGDVVLASDSGWSPRTEAFPRTDGQWGVLKVSAVSWDRFRPDENKQLLPGVAPRLSAAVNRGDFLISRANTRELIAKAVIVVDEPGRLMMSDKIVRLRLSLRCDPAYVLLVNNWATHAREYYATAASGVSASMKNVTRDAIYGLPVPLPPLAEQRRIVAKVNELMTLCDQLEAHLKAGDIARSRLLDALIAETLAEPHAQSA